MLRVKLISVAILAMLSSPSMAGCITGYSLVKTVNSVGVEMCANSNSTTVIQTIDLSKGAGIKSLYNEPTLDKENIERFTKMATKGFTLKAFSIVNGEYFDLTTNPTKLAYPVKEHNKVITNGYAHDKMLAISKGYAFITSDGKSYNSYSQVIGGQSKGNNASGLVGRNLVGVSSDGRKIYVLISTSLTAASAEKIIKSAGAASYMHLDGSGSARLQSDYKVIKGDGRLIPHAIGILSKDQQDASNYIDKCLAKKSSYFGSKVGSLHSDCGAETGQSILFCQSTSAGKVDKYKSRKIAVSPGNKDYYWDYTDAYGWKIKSLLDCN